MSHIYEGVHVSFGIVNPLVVGSRNQVQSLTVNIEHILVCVCYSLCPSFMENVPCPSCYDGYSGNVKSISCNADTCLTVVYKRQLWSCSCRSCRNVNCQFTNRSTCWRNTYLGRDASNLFVLRERD